MIENSDENWFTEICREGGSAISFQIREKLHEEQSPFQRIEIYATTHFGNLMVIDGFVMLTGRDNFLYHEMMSHPALYTHPDPRRAVIIGGGDCGTLREVLKHPGVEHALQVDIDERVTRLAEQYFPELVASNDDPRAELSFGDGIQWMKRAPADSVDVIIVDSTDPIGPAEGLFTEAFFRDCHRVLGDRGVMAQQSESPLLHYDRIIRPLHQAMRAAGFADSVTLPFPQPC
ncbi:MAG: polyamine aminopropyltransferase, partial [Gammaproteobacteria bacterium]